MLAAAIGAASLCALALQLDPDVPLRAAAPTLLAALFLPWLTAGTLALGLVALLATAVRWWPRPFRPVVEHQPFLAALTFLALFAVAAIYWHNLFVYRHALPVVGVRALAGSAVAVTASVLLLVAIGLDVLLFPRHERPAAGALAVLAAIAAVAVPLALRPSPQRRPAAVPVRLDASHPTRRVVVVGLDGLSPADVDAAVDAARVPALARLARRGGTATLATLRPTEGAPVWTTLVTGRLPRDHGIRSASSYRLLGSSTEWALLPRATGVGALERGGLVSRRPVPSTARRCRALWNVLDAFGISSGLVRVWGTHPPEAIRGFVVSPYFHLLRRDPERASTTLHPKDLLREVQARAVEPAEVDPGLLRELAEPRPPGGPLEDPVLHSLAEESLAPDLTYERAADVLRQAYDPSLLIVAFHGYDTAGHAFYRYAHPEAFGNVDAGDARRYGGVLAGYADARRPLGGGGREGAAARRPDRRAVRPRPRADAALAEAARCPDRHGHADGRPRRRAARRAADRRGGDPPRRPRAGRDGAGRGADAALPDGPARGARHGGPRAERARRPGLRARTPGDVHPELREPGRRRRRRGAGRRRPAAARGRAALRRAPRALVPRRGPR